MNVMTVGGIDPSSRKIAIVESRASNKSKAFIHVITLNSDDVVKNQHAAFDFIFDWGMGVIDRDGQPPRIFLEEAVMGGGGQQGKFRPGPTIAQCYVAGTIMAAAGQLGSQLKLVNNSTWKKRVLGNGNIKKEDIAGVMEEVWPEFMKKVPTIHAKQHNGKIPNDSPDQDVVDAGGLNLFGWHNVELLERIKKRRS